MDNDSHRTGPLEYARADKDRRRNWRAVIAMEVIAILLLVAQINDIDGALWQRYFQPDGSWWRVPGNARMWTYFRFCQVACGLLLIVWGAMDVLYLARLHAARKPLPGDASMASRWVVWRLLLVVAATVTISTAVYIGWLVDIDASDGELGWVGGTERVLTPTERSQRHFSVAKHNSLDTACWFASTGVAPVLAAVTIYRLNKPRS